MYRSWKVEKFNKYLFFGQENSWEVTERRLHDRKNFFIIFPHTKAHWCKKLKLWLVFLVMHQCVHFKKIQLKIEKMQKTDLYAQKNTRSRVGWPKIFLFYFSAPKVVQSAKNRNENFLFCVELKIISLFFQKKRWRFAKGTGSTEKRNRNKKPIIWKNSPWQITYVQKIFLSKISYFSVRWAMFWSISTILPPPVWGKLLQGSFNDHTLILFSH